ncbi:hypothetical protein BGI30_08525 [Snodgrassella alvi]|jgi:hypothetical protein|uniref:hypothetical protein n=1 Tax=Snodgrassella alvi TaxID=1196083 RepID=UPI000C1EC357|nr:hypothetical protein [Snodgrassella alvi]PIT09191.1 hypothetical protein BGI30_08525 [Snodgrassella alvi]PIT25184.1 hypothetical protein BGI37_07185 [Snodgrassella alvi]PIT25806.1 hypothetical protein BGI37_06190 [Snodgrassella alvi]PIT27228.1 hypothetical protein BGI37_04065 [Snodgrassella alvi]PIT56664.1 hypothetical protein BHC59_07175 [Snodgrassella alvi]
MYSYKSKILNLVDISIPETDSTQLSHDIHQAICELSYSLQGISCSAYAAACSFWQKIKCGLKQGR